MKPEISFVLFQNNDCTALKEALEKAGYSASFETNETGNFSGKLEGTSKDTGNGSSADDGRIVVTDDESLACRLRKHGSCVIGYQSSQDSRAGKYFHGADYVLTSGDASGVAFIEDVWRRFRGLPYTVGTTRRLIIRESIPEDFGELYRIAGEQRAVCDQPDAGQVFSEKPYKSRKEAENNYLAYIGTMYRFFGFGLWTVFRKDSGRIIGRCGLCPQADDYSPDGRIELGYLIDRGERRKGYALEACREILNFAFRKMDIHELYVRIDERNAPSAKLASRLGFRMVSDCGNSTGLWILQNQREYGEASDVDTPGEYRSQKTKSEETP